MPETKPQRETTSVPGICRKGNRYELRYRHRGKSKSRFYRTFAEARNAKATIHADIARGEYKERERTSFAEYARDWIDTYNGRTTRGFRERTRANYRRSIEQQAIPYFTGKLVDIEPRDVRLFIAWLFEQPIGKEPDDGDDTEARKPKLSTVRNHVAALRVLLATAVEDGLLRHNPALGVRISSSKETITTDEAEQRRALTKAELKRFLAACPGEWRLFFEVLVHSGMRIGEIVELRWGDVDLGAKRIRVRRQYSRGVVSEPKSRNGKRDIPISTAMARRLWKLRRPDDQLVFTNAKGDHVREHIVRHNVLKPTAIKAGVPWVTFHSFRHTTASLLFDAGRNVKVVQEWLGHADPGFTLRTYVHLIDDGMGDADFLDDAVKAPRGPHRGPHVTPKPAETTEAA